MTIIQSFVAGLMIVVVILAIIAYQGMRSYPSTKIPYSIWYKSDMDGEWHEYVLKK